MQELSSLEIEQVAGAGSSTLDLLFSQLQSAAASGSAPATTSVMRELWAQQAKERDITAALNEVASKL